MGGGFLSVHAGGVGVTARARLPGQAGCIEVPAARIIDCRGICRDAVRNGWPLMRAMVERGGAGPARPVADRLDVAMDCTIHDHEEQRIEGLFAIGPT